MSHNLTLLMLCIAIGQLTGRGVVWSPPGPRPAQRSALPLLNIQWCCIHCTVSCLFYIFVHCTQFQNHVKTIIKWNQTRIYLQAKCQTWQQIETRKQIIFCVTNQDDILLNFKMQEYRTCDYCISGISNWKGTFCNADI